eukprot:14319820-Ditylum_brightwellii.AAC.1
MHGPNRTHTTKDCSELKRRAKCTKADTTHDGADKVTYKGLNAFVNAKVTAALNKAKKSHKKKGKSSNEESNHKVNALANASDDDSDSGASCVQSNNSDSNNE